MTTLLSLMPDFYNIFKQNASVGQQPYIGPNNAVNNPSSYVKARQVEEQGLSCLILIYRCTCSRGSDNATSVLQRC